MTNPDRVLAFWLDEVGPVGWYKGGAELDQQVRDMFEAAWNSAQVGGPGLWLTCPSGALAYIILNDQFPRNMFRDSGKAFASDRKALAAAKMAIRKGWDLHIDEPARQFFYMPLMHSENLCDQDRCVRLMLTRMPANIDTCLLHARAHREVIRRFGRFPTRNTALARTSTVPETEYVANGGYRAAVEAVSAA